MRLSDYHPSMSVHVLLRLVVTESDIHEDEHLGMISAIIALIDHETDHLYDDSEIGKHVGKLFQEYLSEWQRDPW